MRVSDEDIECIRRLTRRLDGGIQGQQVRRGYEGAFDDMHRELLLLRKVADAAAAWRDNDKENYTDLGLAILEALKTAGR